MIYKTGTKLTARDSGYVFEVISSTERVTVYRGSTGTGTIKTTEVPEEFVVDAPEALSALDMQVDGDHYKKLGAYQPWEVLRHWLTPEEFRGYMKGTAIAYLAREQDKGGDQDIRKACHTLQGLIELMGDK